MCHIIFKCMVLAKKKTSFISLNFIKSNLFSENQYKPVNRLKLDKTHLKSGFFVHNDRIFYFFRDFCVRYGFKVKKENYLYQSL